MNYFNRIRLLCLPVWLDIGLIIKPRIINLDKIINGNYSPVECRQIVKEVKVIMTMKGNLHNHLCIL